MGAVQAGEPEEDRGERAVAGVEADVRVLDHLREQEREPEQDRQHEPGLETGAVPRRIDCTAQCIVKLE